MLTACVHRASYFPGSLLLSAALLCSASFAQSLPPARPTPPSEQSAPALKRRSPEQLEQAQKKERRFTLDVQVTESSGHAIHGLVAKDFTVLDDGQVRPVTDFAVASESAPAEMTIVVDAVNSPFQSVALADQEITKFLTANNGRLALPVSLVLFTDKGPRMNQPTRDGKTLARELKENATGLRTIRSSAGIYGAIERLDLSLAALRLLATYEQTRPGRKLVVWISYGWPLLESARFQASRTQQQQVFASIIEMSSLLRQSRITLYSINSQGMDPSQFFYQEYLKGVRSVKDASTANLALPVLAIQTGGTVSPATYAISNEISRCVSDGLSFYTVSFDAAPAADNHFDEYHPLQVLVDRAGAITRTRSAYYAEP